MKHSLGARDTPGAVSIIPLRGPRIRELSPRQVESVLARNSVARIAFQANGRPELVPVHYVYADTVLYGRTSAGGKHSAWLGGVEVVAEIDEVDGLFDWRSVIVRGSLSILRPRGPRAEPFSYWNAVAALRRLFPAAFTERDPMPYRGIVFRITPAVMSGREAIAR